MDKNLKIYYIIITLSLIIILILLFLLILVFNDSESIIKPDNNNIIEPIQNKKILSSIKILRMPYKLQYKEGEIFDKSGMIIKGIYDDNSQSYVDSYIIDKVSPLTIYDSLITISYKGKKVNISIKITNDEEIEIFQNPSNEKYTLEIIEGITRFEIEDSDISNWIISEDNNKNKIIERNDASRGSFLKGIDDNVNYEGELIFYLNLNYNVEVVMSVSYAQNEKWKNDDIDISSIYNVIIDENKVLEIDGESTLKSREDITKWQIIKYKSYNLIKGKHTITIKTSSNNKIGSPNIDYIDFKTKEIGEIIEPDDEIPSNDFHTLLQYKFIIDEPENVFNYASGIEDLSRPKGNLLDFSEDIKDISDSYVIQISSSEAFDTSDTKIINNLKEKKYIIKNLKLGQKIFYRGAINEEELNNSKIYTLTTNTLAPRNLDIPGVDNFRDIGGIKTTLVKNGIINQGLYYRTAQINDIEEEGKRILKEDLGIKIEIDLRDEIYNTGPYVDGIEYHPITVYSGSEYLWFDSFENQYIKIFNLISEADKNPIVLHCTHGADRTGIMTFGLLTLLGCEYNDIMRDYAFTNFGVQGSRNVNGAFKTWWNKLDKYEGETKSEKCKSWLMKKGIEESKLEHIRSIFIDNYEKNNSISLKKNINNLQFFEINKEIIYLNSSLN